MNEHDNEADFRSAVVRDLQRLGFMVYAIFDRGQSLGDTGYPDITAARHGQIVYIRCRPPNDRRKSEDEYIWEEMLERNGATFAFYDIVPNEWQGTLQDIQSGY